MCWLSVSAVTNMRELLAASSFSLQCLSAMSRGSLSFVFVKLFVVCWKFLTCFHPFAT